MALGMAASIAAEPALKPKPAPTRSLDHAGRRAAELTPDRMIVYREIAGRELKLHVFLPEGWKPTDRRPCFHIIHGGGWGGMDPSRMYPFAADFARRYGMVAVAPEYRLYRPDRSVSVFDCVDDANASVRYLRTHAAELGIDPERLVVSGASAGGHLAVGTALFAGEGDAAKASRPNALVLLFPVIDTSKDGYGQAKIGERWRELSPMHQVRPGLPPTLTFHGTGDTTTPFAGAKAFHEKMVAAGNRSELEVNEGGVHGYLMREEALYEATISRTAEFLQSLGILSTAP